MNESERKAEFRRLLHNYDEYWNELEALGEQMAQMDIDDVEEEMFERRDNLEEGLEDAANQVIAALREWVDAE